MMIWPVRMAYLAALYYQTPFKLHASYEWYKWIEQVGEVL